MIITGWSSKTRVFFSKCYSLVFIAVFAHRRWQPRTQKYAYTLKQIDNKNILLPIDIDGKGFFNLYRWFLF